MNQSFCRSWVFLVWKPCLFGSRWRSWRNSGSWSAFTQEYTMFLRSQCFVQVQVCQWMKLLDESTWKRGTAVVMLGGFYLQTSSVWPLRFQEYMRFTRNKATTVVKVVLCDRWEKCDNASVFGLAEGNWWYLGNRWRSTDKPSDQLYENEKYRLWKYETVFVMPFWLNLQNYVGLGTLIRR